VKALLLEIEDITVHYYKVPAVRNISIAVQDGEIVALIGSNGAGKTTTLRAVSGLKHPTTGEIHFKGQRIDKLPPHKINALGIAMVPEGRQVFPQMTVLENLLMGAFLRKDTDEIQKDLGEVIFRHFPRLKERKNQPAGTLSGGEQQMLAMGRALMSAPKLLLMDEPSLGLSPIMCGEIGKIIRDIHTEGKTVILVEQNARLALALSQHAYVIETGGIALSGLAEELSKDDNVKKAYLGG
jgi:branched-chain amino acid transport system ATP-binding protein